VLGVDSVVEAADVGGGEFAGEIGQRGAELGNFSIVDWRMMGTAS